MSIIGFISIDAEGWYDSQPVIRAEIMSSTPPLIRFAHPMAVQSFLRHIGAPADRLLQHNDLPAHCDQPDVFVPVLRVWEFFDEAARKEDHLLGWDAGKHVGDHSLNRSLLRKLERAPTLLKALQRLSELIRSEGSDVDIGVFERREDILLYTHYWDLANRPGYHISQAYQLAVFLDLIRFFLGGQWMPDEIGLEAAVIPSGLENRLPGTRILLNQPFGYVAIARKLLHHAACHRISQGTGNKGQVTVRSFGYVDKFRSVARAYLSEGYVSEQHVARLMDTSVRTMKRRLAAMDLSYRALIDEVRFDVARENLRNSDMRIIEVARSVGFRDQANFTRMFRRIAGITPNRYRKITLCEEPATGPQASH